MKIQFFNLLEDNRKDFVEQLFAELRQKLSADNDLPDAKLRHLLDSFVGSFTDELVIGHGGDSSDQVNRVLSSLAALHGSAFRTLLELPMMLSAIIGRLLVKEYSERTDPIDALSEAFEKTDPTARSLECRLLDMFQEQRRKDSVALNDDVAQGLKELEFDPSVAVNDGDGVDREQESSR